MPIIVTQVYGSGVGDNDRNKLSLGSTKQINIGSDDTLSVDCFIMPILVLSHRIAITYRHQKKVLGFESRRYRRNELESRL
jgi:hypothetical protein